MMLKTRIADHKQVIQPNGHPTNLCHFCWSGYIYPCRCGGAIHNEFESNDWDDVILNYECSSCGDDWDFLQLK